MRHRSKKTTLGRERGPRRSLLRILATDLIAHGHLTTTLAKARFVRPFVERLVTNGKENTVTNRRHVERLLGNDRAAKRVLTVISPKFKSRPGGYTRIIKLGRRQGDAALTARIEFVETV